MSSKTTNPIIDASEILPIELFNLVLKYFNGTPSAKAVKKHKEMVMVNFIREKKSRINKIILDAEILRTHFFRDNNGVFIGSQYDEDTETGEHWSFASYDTIYDTAIFELQGINCKKCGNYCNDFIDLDFIDLDLDFVNVNIWCRCYTPV